MLWLVTVCRPAKAFNFYSGHPDVCTAIIIKIYKTGGLGPNKWFSVGPSINKIVNIKITMKIYMLSLIPRVC